MLSVTRAAAAVISDSEGRVLLIRQNHGHKQWALPGAHVEAVDVPTDAIVREIRQETGLETQVQSLVGLYHLAGGTDEELPDLLTYAFQCRMVGGEAVLNQSQQGRIGQLAWHAPQEPPEPATATAGAVLADVAAGRVGVVRRLSR